MAKPIFLRRENGQDICRIKFHADKKYRATFTGPSEECVEWWWRQKLAYEDAKKGEVAPATSPLRPNGGGTVRELVEHFRRSLEDRGLASAKDRGFKLNAMLRSGAAFVDRQAVHVAESDDMQTWFDKAINGTKRGGKLYKPATVISQRDEWRRVFRYGIRKQLCGLTRQSRNPALDIEMPKRNAEGRPVKMTARDRVLEAGEWERWLKAANEYLQRQNQFELVEMNGRRDPQIVMPNYVKRKGGVPCGHGNFPDPRACEEVHPYALIHLATWKYLTGMRMREILRLKVDDVSEKIAKLVLTKTGEDQKRALSGEAWEWLKGYLTKRKEWIQCSLRKDEPLFPWYASEKNISTQFRRICDLAKIEGLQLRDLRADFATRLVLELDGNLGVVRRFTGHSADGRVLEKIYVRVSPEKAADILRAKQKIRDEEARP
jgi:integrase